MTIDAVIVAAGSSTRFGDRDKLLAELAGEPVIAWCLRTFEAADGIGQVIIVTSAANLDVMRAAGQRYAPNRFTAVIEGGARRRDSVEAGLRACRSTYVAIHDAARPLITVDVITRALTAAEAHTGGAIPVVPVTDSIKQASGGLVVDNPDRATLFAAQTPQVVHRTRWLHAASTSDNDETDDAAMLARLGLEVATVEGDITNLKITRPLDLLVAEALLAERKASRQ